MIISEEQIKLIANNIAFDVHQYIIEHQEEYQLYLEQEKKLQQIDYVVRKEKSNENESKKDSRSSKP